MKRERVLMWALAFMVALTASGAALAAQDSPARAAESWQPDAYTNVYDAYDSSYFEVMADTGDGLVMAGGVVRSESIVNDGFVVKYGYDGTHIWTAVLPAAEGTEIFLTSIKPYPGGGCVVGGFEQETGDGGYPPAAAYVVRLDSEGNIVWKYSSFGEFERVIYDVAVDNGNVIAVGYETASGGDASTRALALTFGPNGNLQATRHLVVEGGGGFMDVSNGMMVTLLEYGESSGIGLVDLSQSTLTLGYRIDDNSFSITNCALADGGMLLSGLQEMEGVADEAAVMMLNDDRTVAWKRTLQGSGYDEMSHVAMWGDKYIALGNAESTDGDYEDTARTPDDDTGFLAVFDKAGGLLNVKRLLWDSIDGMDAVYDILVRGDCIYLCGYQQGTDRYASFARIEVDMLAKDKPEPTPTVAPTATPQPTATPAPTPGAMPGNGWYRHDGTGRWLYAENGQAVQGWKKVDGNWYYFGDSAGQDQRNTFSVDSGSYYVDGNTVACTGWKRIGGSWYYFRDSGKMVTGWQKDGGSWYYLQSGGKMATGWQKVGGGWYYFSGNGKMKTGWHSEGGKWYYLRGSGKMATGWEKVGGRWYWFDGSGVMATGSRSIGGTAYRFGADGVMAE